MKIWKEIPGFGGRYVASDAGEIMSINSRRTGLPRILRPQGYGYKHVGVGGRYRRIHDLVALAFLGPRPSGFVINHKNGTPTDNRPSNLEYCTQKENVRHAFSSGLCGGMGQTHYQAKLTNKQVSEVRKLLASGLTQQKIGEQVGVSQSNVSYIKTGHTWKHAPHEVAA